MDTDHSVSGVEGAGSGRPGHAPRRPTRLRRHLLVATALLAGIAVSLAGYVIAERWERSPRSHGWAYESDPRTAVFPPARGGESTAGGVAALAVLAAGLTLTGALAAYLFSFAGRNSRVARLVDERTTALASAVATLEQEIAERDRARAALRASESRYRTLVQASPDAIFIHCDGKLVFANLATMALVGVRSADQILGVDPIEFIHPADRHLIVARRDEIKRGNRALAIAEVRYRSFDGRISVVETTAVSFNWHGRSAHLVMVRDVTQHRSAEEALRYSERRFRDFADAASDWLWETDEDHRFVWVSEGMSRYSEMPVADILGRTHWEIDGVADDLSELRLCMEALLPFRDIRYSRHGSGERRRYRSINGRPMFDESGRFTGHRGTTTDTTAEVEAQERAERASGLFEDAVEKMSDSFGLFDTEDRLLLCNEGFRRFSRLPPEFVKPELTFEVLVRAMVDGGTLDETFEGSKEDWIARRLQRHRNPSGPFTVRSHGRWRQIREQRLADGSTILISTDVTDQVKAEQAARDNDAQMWLVTDAIPAMVAYVDRDHRIRFANKPFAAWFGFYRDDILGMHMRDVAGEQAYLANKATMDRALAGEVVTEEYEPIHPARRSSYIRISRVPHFGDDGTVPGYFVIVIDLTEHRLREQRLRRAQRMEAVGQLTGGVAHEFNNLLMVVLGNLELLEERLPPNDDLRELAASAKRGALRGGELTKRLLAFSRKQKLATQPIDINVLVSDTVDMLCRTLGAAVTIGIEPQDELWQTISDPGQIEAALLNFAINGRDAMPDGGTIVIRTENRRLSDADRQPDVGSGDYIMLEVADTGCGMAPEIVGRAASSPERVVPSPWRPRETAN